MCLLVFKDGNTALDRSRIQRGETQREVNATHAWEHVRERAREWPRRAIRVLNVPNVPMFLLRNTTPQYMISRASLSMISFLVRTRTAAHHPCVSAPHCVSIPQYCNNSAPWALLASGRVRLQPPRSQIINITACSNSSTLHQWINKFINVHQTSPPSSFKSEVTPHTLSMTWRTTFMLPCSALYASGASTHKLFSKEA